MLNVIMNLVSIGCLYMVIYYGIVLYTMYKFFKNACRCKKMEGYKKTWNFYYIVVYSFIAFISGIYVMLQSIGNKSGICKSVTLLITMMILHLPAHFNDYAVLSLLHRMKKDGCPCTSQWRDIVEKMTYIRLVFSIILIHKRYDNIMYIKKSRRRNLISI
jgi:hypothetical protein